MMQCPLCASTERREGFCCKGCHGDYMAKQHAHWERQGTCTTDMANGYILYMPLSHHETLRCRGWVTDPCLDTDEQYGFWAIGVRMLEDAR